MQESTPGSKSNPAASPTEIHAPESNKHVQSKTEDKAKDLDINDPSYHYPATTHGSQNKSENDQSNHNHNFSSTGGELIEKSDSRSIISSEQSDDHSSDEDFKPHFEETPAEQTEHAPGEPGPLYANKTHSIDQNHISAQLPQHFRRNSSDTTGQLPLPSLEDSGLPGLPSPNPNSFYLPSHTSQQALQFHESPILNERRASISSHPRLKPPSDPSSSTYLRKPLNPIPRSSSQLSHNLIHSSSQFITGSPFGDLPGTRGDSSRSGGRHYPIPSAYTSHPRSQTHSSLKRNHLRRHSRQSSMQIDHLDELPLPASRPAVGHHRGHSRTSSVYDSDSESPSMGVHPEYVERGRRRHRPSTSIISVGVSASGPSKSLVELHDRANIHQFPSLHSIMVFEKDAPGQSRPAYFMDIKDRMSTDFWKEQNTVCLIIKLNDIYVTRRLDNNLINGTKLLNSAGVSRGRRDGILKAEKERHVVRTGGMGYKGVWIPFERALEMAKQEEVLDTLFPLFLADLRQVFRIPENYSRLIQVVRGGGKITAQLKWWLESMHEPQTFRPGYHFYDQDADALAVVEVTNFNPLDDEPPIVADDALEEIDEESIKTYDHHREMRDPLQHFNNPEYSHALPNIEEDHLIKLPPILTSSTEHQPVAGTSIEESSTRPRVDPSFPMEIPRDRPQSFSSRLVNPDEFMQPPIAQYTEYLRHAYHSYEPRPRDHRFHISDEDEDEETDMEYD